MPPRHSKPAYENIKLEPFDPCTMRTDGVILLVAPRRTGKSFMTHDLLYHVRRSYHRGLMFTKSGTEGDNSLKGVFPKCFFFEKFDARKVLDILAQINAYKAWAAEHPEEPRMASGWFIFIDDFMNDVKELNVDGCLEILVNRGRHGDVGVFITCQDAKNLPPDIRGNIDYAFILSQPSIKAVNRVYDEFAPPVDKKVWNDILTRATENDGCLVLDRSARRADKMAQLKVYKACSIPKLDADGKPMFDANGEAIKESPHKNWILGSKRLHKFAAQITRKDTVVKPNFLRDPAELAAAAKDDVDDLIASFQTPAVTTVTDNAHITIVQPKPVVSPVVESPTYVPHGSAERQRKREAEDMERPELKRQKTVVETPSVKKSGGAQTPRMMAQTPKVATQTPQPYATQVPQTPFAQQILRKRHAENMDQHPMKRQKTE